MKRGLLVLLLIIFLGMQFVISDGLTREVCTDVPGEILECTKTKQGCVYDFDDECDGWSRGQRTGDCGGWFEFKESYICFDDWQSSCISNPTCPAGYSQVSSRDCSEEVCVEEPIVVEIPPVDEPSLPEIVNDTPDDPDIPEENNTEEEPLDNSNRWGVEIHPVEDPPSPEVVNDSEGNEINPVEESPPQIVSQEELDEFKINSTNDSVSDVIRGNGPRTITQVTTTPVEGGAEIYEVKSVQEVETDNGVISVEVTDEVDSESGEVTGVDRVIRRGDVEFKEDDNEVIFLQDGVLVKVSGVDDKEVKIDKMMSNSVHPLVTLEKIVIPGVVKGEWVLLKVRKESYFPDYEIIFEAEDYIIIIVKTDDLESLINNSDVLKISDEESKEAFIEYEAKVLQEEAEKMIEKQELEKSSYGVEDIDKLEEYLEADEWEVQEGHESYYQQFVTPDEVKDYIEDLNEKELYEKVTSFVWMPDKELHGIPEKWMTPVEFLEDSQNLDTNPLGEIASDCSEQANTLVSMLRASGVSAKDVRVVLGKVNFSDVVGGHAWVEIKEGDKWMVLDPSLGPFYDEYFNIKLERDPIKYNYWKYHEYPSVEIWMYYNDVYFTDEEAEVAEGWSKKAETALRSSIFESFDRGMFANFIKWLKNLFS
ncbi:hypothetical protein GOV13_03875 [Candidatus Pacearchaeota archaeon]|nr:hypothetical protein [Candidatus Pacearchaeota archaeon]